MIDNMVERVARVLAPAAFAGGFSSRNAEGAEQARARSLSRRIIAAMREPTTTMRAAAYAVNVPGADLFDFMAYDCAGPVMAAMIDAVLSEDQTAPTG